MRLELTNEDEDTTDNTASTKRSAANHLDINKVFKGKDKK